MSDHSDRTKARLFDEVREILLDDFNNEKDDLNVILEKLLEIVNTKVSSPGICYKCGKHITDSQSFDSNAKGVKHGDGSGCKPFTTKSLQNDMDRYFGY